MSTQNMAKKITKKKKIKNTKIKIKCLGGGGGGPIFSICSVRSVTQCHSWNSLPCSHQQFSIIATYRPPATTNSYSTTSPEKKNPSSNRLGTPPPPLARGVEKPEGPSALQPTTESSVSIDTIGYSILQNNAMFSKCNSALRMDNINW